eukprot:COSAG05_NODE_6907_length_883_cov_1.293367_2_plen_61_part_00
MDMADEGMMANRGLVRGRALHRERRLGVRLHHHALYPVEDVQSRKAGLVLAELRVDLPRR